MQILDLSRPIDPLRKGLKTETLAIGIPWQAEFCLVSYGVYIGVRTTHASVFECLQDYFPPGWERSSSPVVDLCYSLTVVDIDEELHYQLYRAAEKLSETTKLEAALDTFDADLRLQVAIAAPEKLFVHAGVVGWHGQAIVIPGRSFSGKTTLVAALVEAGATYYSDEYAVFDASGLVYPYPRPLSVRQSQGMWPKRCPVEEFGGTAGIEPLPVGLLVHTQYQAGAKWHPSQISAGQAVLALLDNTVVARLRPDLVLPTLAGAVSDASSIEGARGDAQEVAVALLQQLANR
jgi:hypothetical protein